MESSISLFCRKKLRALPYFGCYGHICLFPQSSRRCTYVCDLCNTLQLKNYKCVVSWQVCCCFFSTFLDFWKPSSPPPPHHSYSQPSGSQYPNTLSCISNNEEIYKKRSMPVTNQFNNGGYLHCIIGRQIKRAKRAPRNHLFLLAKWILMKNKIEFLLCLIFHPSVQVLKNSYRNPIH